MQNKVILQKSKSLQNTIKQSKVLSQVFTNQLAYLTNLQSLLGDHKELTKAERAALILSISNEFQHWAGNAADAATELQVHFNSTKENSDDLIQFSSFLALIGLVPDTGGLETYLTLGVTFLNYMTKSLSKKKVSLSEFFSTWQNYFSALIPRGKDLAKKALDELLILYPNASYEELTIKAEEALRKSLKTKKELQQEIMKAWVKQFEKDHSDNIFESNIEKGAGVVIMYLRGTTTSMVYNYHPQLSYQEQIDAIKDKNYGDVNFKCIDSFIDDIQNPKGTNNALKHCFNRLVDAKGDLDIGKLEYLPIESLPFDIRVSIRLVAPFVGADPPPPGGSSVKTEVIFGDVEAERIKGQWKVTSGKEDILKKWQTSKNGHPSVKELKIDTYL